MLCSAQADSVGFQNVENPRRLVRETFFPAKGACNAGSVLWQLAEKPTERPFVCVCVFL